MSNLDCYLFGIMTGIYLLQGIFFLWASYRKAPYMASFGWAMLIGAAIQITEVIISQPSVQTPAKSVYATIGLTIVPFYIMEIFCIVNQDIKGTSWFKRCIMLIILESPIFAMLSYFLISGNQERSILIPLSYASYWIGLFIFMFRRLRRYERLLEKIRNNKNQRVAWVWWIFSLLLVQYLTYFFFNYLTNPTIYSVATYIILILHGYFIYRQSPADTARMEKIALIEAEEQQLQAQGGLKDGNPTGFEKIDMETYSKAFLEKHPNFERELQTIASSKLTKRDIYLCILIYEGKKIPELANHLSISDTSVEVARHRLRAKLNLEKGENLNSTIKGIETNTKNED